MKNILLLFLLSVFFCTNINAQETKYTTHTIAKGETLSAIAKKYHTTVGDIMRLNSMNSTSKLKIGEKVKIPSSSTTQKTTDSSKLNKAKTSSKTTQTKTLSTKPKTDTAVATHYVMKNETLYSISKKFGVTVEQLKEWNNLKDEHVHFGQQLAVSAEGANLLASAKKEKTSAATNTETTDAINKPLVTNADHDSSNNISIQTSNVNTTANDESTGFFAKDFIPPSNKGPKSLTGYATIFKGPTGWKDKKYYIFMNGVPLGSIVKVSTPNGNSIYAKVLWTLDTTANYGYNFRISDAAASALAVNEDAFSLRVEYYQ
jgi:LysM repeat protein